MKFKKFFILSIFLLSIWNLQAIVGYGHFCLEDFFTVMDITDRGIQKEFSDYYHRFARQHNTPKKRKKYSYQDLHKQALCDIEIYHPQWYKEVKNTSNNECDQNSSFLTFYALFMKYKREHCLSHNGTLFRLSSYIKDTTKVCTGWFKSASKKERFLRSTEGLIS